MLKSFTQKYPGFRAHQSIFESLGFMIWAPAFAGVSGLEGVVGFYVYILASARNGTIYVGMTDDLHRRVTEHKAKIIPGFTTKHGCDRLVWFEEHATREEAFRRERRIKEWRRSWKLSLIEESNSTWRDLFEDFHSDLDAEAWLSRLAEEC